MKDAMTKFSDLGLAETLLRALDREGYETPTSIQAQAIPFLQQGRDLLGIAQTGTGKTAAFALPILNRLLADRRRPAPFTARALILAPTRELAAQIADSFRAYGQFMRPSVGVIVGGVSHRPQVDMLSRGLEVLVATPGRLLDHIASGRLKLATTEILVLDEADHMLDLGFIVPIRQIVSKLPKQRQTLLFSATMPKEIAGPCGGHAEYAGRGLGDARRHHSRARRSACVPRRRRRQARHARRADVGRASLARHRLHAHQARRRSRGAASGRRRRRRRGDSRQ